MDIEAVLGTKEFNMPIDYWMEISRALNVAGDLILDRRVRVISSIGSVL